MIKHIEGGVLCDGLFCDGKHGICPRCKCFKRKKKKSQSASARPYGNGQWTVDNEQLKMKNE